VPPTLDHALAALAADLDGQAHRPRAQAAD
jgi:hypothetical protein